MMTTWRLSPITIVASAIAVVMLLGACGDSSDTDAMDGVMQGMTAQSAEIEALAEQVSGLQAQLAETNTTKAAAADVAALQAVIDDLDMDEDGDERAEDYSDEIQALEATIADLGEAVTENADDIEAIPNAMSAIATSLMSEHSNEHNGLEAAIQAAFDEHGINHDALETAIEDAIGGLMEDGENEDGEIAELVERIEWLNQAVAPAYTQAYVEEAMRRYNSRGRRATLDYYNTMDSVSGDLYLFVLDENYELIVHPTVPTNIGMDIRGPLGTDITGKNYGSEFVTVDESGKWVDYVYLNPADDFNYERKHSWIVRHENLIFGSGWYDRDVSLDSTPDSYARALVEQAVARYDALGHDATIAHYNDPASVDGQYYVFIGDDENDVMLAHAAVPENVGKRFDEVISPDGYPAGAQAAAAAVEGGAWTTYTYLNASTGNAETKHSWVTRHKGMIFGSGWYEEGPPKSDAPAYTQSFVRRAMHLYDDLGLEGTLDYYNSPESVDGQWYVFIVDSDDLFLSHAPSPSLLGTDLKDVVGSDGFELGKEIAKATEEGHWVEYLWPNPATDMEETKRSWVIRHDGLIFGSGYYGE